MLNNFKLTFSRREFLFLILCFLIAFYLRLIYLRDYAKINIYFPILKDSDSFYYLKWAKDIAEGDILGKQVFMKWPFYAYFLALLLKLFNYELIYIYLFQFFLGALNCVLIYTITRKIFNKITGLAAILLYISYGLFIFYEGLLIYTSLSIFLNLILFLYFLYLKENLNRKNLFIGGLLLGICTLTQANVIIFGILAIIFILLEKKISLRYFIYNLLAFFVGLIMILDAVFLRNYFVAKDNVLLSANLGFNFYLGNNPDNPEGFFYYPFYINSYQEGIFRDAKVISKIETGKNLRPSEVSLFWIKKAMKFILKRPILYLRIQLNKLIHLFSPFEYIHDWEFFGIKERIGLFKYIPLDVNYLIGFFYLGVILGIKKIKENYLLYLALFSFSFSIILFFVATRYRMSMVVFLIIFSSFGLTQIINLFFQKKYLKFLFTIGLLILISFIFNYNFKEKKLCINKGLVSHLEKVMYYKDKLDYLSALKEVESVSNLEPENPLILNILGELYYHLNDFERAKQIYKKIIIKYPFFVDAYYNLGLIYNRQGLYAQAEEVLIKAIDLDPEDTQAHFELGKAYKGLGDKFKAKQEFWFVLNRIDLTNREDREKIEKEFFELIEEWNPR